MPRASSSLDVRSASRSAGRSGRATRTTVVRVTVDERVERLDEARLLHLQAGVRPEARRALVRRLEERRPRARKTQETQRVARRRRVEQDVIERSVLAREQRSERIERGDLDGARAGELLAELGDLGLRPDRSIRRDDALAVSVGRSIGIDVQREESPRRR